MLALSSTHAFAHPGPDQHDDDEDHEDEGDKPSLFEGSLVSYQRETITLDLIAGGVAIVGVVALGSCLRSDDSQAEEGAGDIACPMALGGLGGAVAMFLVASPINHARNGNPGGAAYSFLLRLGLTSGAVAIAVASKDVSVASLAGIGALVGAAAIDASFLSEEIVLTPVMRTDGLGLGIVGSF